MLLIGMMEECCTTQADTPLHQLSRVRRLQAEPDWPPFQDAHRGIFVKLHRICHLLQRFRSEMMAQPISEDSAQPGPLLRA